ncbi:amino acid ABC transporter substrate-binding protein [Hahella sp. CCB-MM4]|uniref:transporter substrate-binding domain-containing protein n=1 Tax=Hahella sp. (strain CCB-MM4) TaxID=1926491 RepID=UPI000B9C6B6F|nr:transporter substrate-binding domain-containing protein [Hahella sp. CCB-MM4]OZG74888.1 amino acid ABC transporter substrate-binding protein [Hahella sp. CCB-MM4]
MKIISTLIVSLLFAFSVQAETVTAAQDPWPPFIQEGSDPGISIALLKAAMAKEGYTVDFKIMPWNRALNEVKNGNVDLLPGAWYTEEREGYLIYSDYYAQNSIKFIKKKGDAFEFNGLDSLSGKKVGIVSGYGYGDEFSKAGNFSRPEAGSIEANIKKLLSGRIDLTLEDEIVAKSVIKGAGLDLGAVDFTTSALSVNNLHVAAGRANARGQKIIDAYNRGLAAIKADGTYNKILADYGVK